MRHSSFAWSLGFLLTAAGPAAAGVPAKPEALARLAPRAGTTCPLTPLSCGQTVNGTLATTDCQEPANGGGFFYDDLYGFTATAGQQIAISLSSATVDTYLFIEDGAGNVIQQDDDGGGGTNSRASFTVPTSGTYYAVASSAQTAATGPYSLTLACGSSGATTCAPGPTTLCLVNNRFQVQATFQSAQQSGQAQIVKLTDDTGYLWFFNASNVETVLKVLDGCTLGGHYWFFAGGLTNVDTQIKVTDTTTGFTRLYTNPLNQAFEPIQDTSAFPNCP